MLPERRVVAILFTDVVKSCRAAYRNEPEFLAARREDLGFLRDRTRDRGGKVEKSTGDGLLITFPSAVQALAAAIEFQRHLDERRTLRRPDGGQIGVNSRALLHRIGLHLGDVSVEDDDVLGHAVNFAKRLEENALHNAIHLSEPARSAVASSYPGLRPRRVLHFSPKSFEPEVFESWMLLSRHGGLQSPPEGWPWRLEGAPHQPTEEEKRAERERKEREERRARRWRVRVPLAPLAFASVTGLVVWAAATNGGPAVREMKKWVAQVSEPPKRPEPRRLPPSEPTPDPSPVHEPKVLDLEPKPPPATLTGAQVSEKTAHLFAKHDYAGVLAVMKERRGRPAEDAKREAENLARFRDWVLARLKRRDVVTTDAFELRTSPGEYRLYDPATEDESAVSLFGQGVANAEIASEELIQVAEALLEPGESLPASAEAFRRRYLGPPPEEPSAEEIPPGDVS